MSAVKQRISDDRNRHPASEFEGEIREFIRRDVTMRRPDHAEPGIENLNSLIERVSAATVIGDRSRDRRVAEHTEPSS